MIISRQFTRQLARVKKKFNHRLAQGSVDSEGKSRHKMGLVRSEILDKLSVALAGYNEPPKSVPTEDRLSYRAEQLNTAQKLNKEWMDKSRGKGGKKPTRVSFVPSIALRKDNTNQIGHFA